MFTTVTNDVREDEAKKEEKIVSEEAVRMAERSIRHGLVRSLGIYLFSRSGEEREVHKKVMTFINALRANKDIDADQAEMLEKYYVDMRSLQFAVDPNCATPVCEESYSLWYTIINSLFDDKWCCDNIAYCADQEKCTDYEYELIQSFKEAQDAYWKTRQALQNHYRKILNEAAKRTLLKYGTTLIQIAPSWYKSVIKAAGLKPEVNAQPE